MKGLSIKRAIAAIAAVPIFAAGLALPASAMAADNDPVTLASFSFDDDTNGFVSSDAKATKNGNITLEASKDAANGKAAKFGDNTWLNLTRTDGSSLLTGLDDVTISYDSKPTFEKANRGWTAFLAPNANQQEYRQEHYFAIMDGRDGNKTVATEKYDNSGTRDSSGNIAGQTRTEDWDHVELTLSGNTSTMSINGEPVADNNQGPKLTDILGEDGGVFQIGRANWSSSGEYYHGLIDNFTVTTTAASAAKQAAAMIDLGNTSNVTSNLTLPTTGVNGATISWSSSDTSVVSNDGKVTQGATDKTVQMTATVNVDGASDSRVFTIIVPAAITTAEQAADRLLVDYQLTAGTKLPTAISGAPDAKVAWMSSDTKLVGNDGVVIGADGDTAKSVDLTATVTLGNTTKTKAFKGVQVMPKNAVTLASYTRANGVDGGARVGQSLHLALSTDGSKFQALNQNYGVVFAEANFIRNEADKTLTTEGVEIGRGIADPYLFRMKDGQYAFVSTLTKYNTKAGSDNDATIRPADPGYILFLSSDDLAQWKDSPNDDTTAGRVQVTKDATAFDAGSLTAGWDVSANAYRVGWTVNGVAKYVTTTDFKTFSEVKNGPAFSKTTPDLTGISKAVASNSMAVDKATADKLAEKLGRVQNTEVEQNQELTFFTDGTKDDLLKQVTGVGENGKAVTLKNGNLSKGLTAKATYSDGSTHDFRVNWNADDLAKVDISKPGTYTVNGTINQQNFSDGTMMQRRADPNVVYWEGKYYFIATTEPGDRNIYIRVSDTMEGLKDTGNRVSDGDGAQIQEGQDHFLWGNKDNTGHDGYHWAPELHAITDSQGKQHLYCFFAQYPTGKDGDAKLNGSPNWAGPSAYVYELKDGGDPTKTADWTEHRVLNKAGSELNLKALTIDMTYFEVKGQSYVAWSQGDDTYKGARASLYIAKTNPDKPWQITSDAVRIVQPVYGWELSGVSEGPNVLVHDGKVYMVFSAQQVGTQYATGMMIADEGADLTDPSVWTKSNYPWMHNGVFPGQSGLGHNSYFSDPYGDIYNVYHFGGNGSRNTSIVPVYFRADGSPILDMKTSEELDQSKKNVTLTIKVVDKAEASKDATLKSLTVDGVAVDVEAAASENGTELKVVDPAKISVDSVKAEVNDAKAQAVVAVKDGVVTVTVTAENGDTKVYTIKLVKDSGEQPVDPDKPDNGNDNNQSEDTSDNGGDASKTTDSDDSGDAAKSDNKSAGKSLSNTGVAVAVVAGVAVLLAAAGVALTVLRKRRA